MVRFLFPVLYFFSFLANWLGELPEHAKINETDTYGDGGEGDVGFEFDEERDDSSEEGAGKDDIVIDDI